MAISLEGVTVVNTRPTHQAEPLCDLIRGAGGAVVEFPVIQIVPVDDVSELRLQLERLKAADMAIFISANAVDAAITAMGGEQRWPSNVTIASVGKATAARLASHGLIAEIVAPEPCNSEALLSMPGLMNLTHKKVLIIRGAGGREFLADTLRSRGADVEYIECYRRERPASYPAGLYQSWDEKRKLVIVVTSNEGLSNLQTMIDKDHQPDLLASTLVVVSERAVNLALELGFSQKPILAQSASNEAIFNAILDYQHHG
jgi:uroporphyrinogen-III synthase